MVDSHALGIATKEAIPLKAYFNGWENLGRSFVPRTLQGSAVDIKGKGRAITDIKTDSGKCILLLEKIGLTFATR